MAVNIVDVFVNDKYKQRTLSPQTNMYDTKNTCRAVMLKKKTEKKKVLFVTLCIMVAEIVLPVHGTLSVSVK